MGTVNYSDPKTDTSVKIFDRFYDYELSVPVDAYDAVLSYFRSVFGTGEAAGNFAVTLFRVAELSDIPVLTLLQQIQGQTGPDLTFSLAYYINATRSNSTLLGINVATQPNFYVAHNIRN
jgi:hypothetical protein